MQKQDHKENLNEPRGRLAWLCPAMYKLAFCSSSISKYSCLAPIPPLASLSLLSLSIFLFFFFFLPPFLLLQYSPLPEISLFFCFLLFFSSFFSLLLPLLLLLSVRSCLLWAVPDSYKSANVNHHVLALCSIGYTEKATKSLLIWMWYTPCSLTLSATLPPCLAIFFVISEVSTISGERLIIRFFFFFFFKGHRYTSKSAVTEERGKNMHPRLHLLWLWPLCSRGRADQ